MNEIYTLFIFLLNFDHVIFHAIFHILFGLVALKELNPSTDETTTSNTNAPTTIPYCAPDYTQDGVYNRPVTHHPNQYTFQSHMQPAGNEAPTYLPTNAWSQDYGMFDMQKSPPIVPDARYFPRYEPNAFHYDSQAAIHPSHMNMAENPAREPNWHPQQSTSAPVHNTAVQSTSDYNDGYQAAAIPYASPPITNSKPMHKNEDEVFEDSNSPKEKTKIRRPMNSFMLYAKRHRNQVHQMYPMCDNRTVSKILSDSWYHMDPNMKQAYHDLANDMRRVHYEMYPDYRWKTTSERTQQTISPTQQKNEQSLTNNLPDCNAQMQSFDGPSKNLPSPFFATSPGATSTENPWSPLSYLDEKLAIEPFPVETQPSFRLGPTPAQLKRKAKATDKIINATSNEQNDCDKDTNADTESSVDHSSQLEEYKNRFSTLPQFDFTNYRNTTEWNTSPTSPIQYNTITRKRALPLSASSVEQQCAKKRLVGDRFFGPDFNVNTNKGRKNKIFQLYLYKHYNVIQFKLN